MLKSFSIHLLTPLEKFHWWERQVRKDEKKSINFAVHKRAIVIIDESCASRMKGPRSLCRKKPWLCNTYCVIIKERRLCVTMTQNFDTHYTFRDRPKSRLLRGSFAGSIDVSHRTRIRIWNIVLSNLCAQLYQHTC